LADFLFFTPQLATAEDLDRIVGVNLRGTFLCFKYAGLQMIAQGRGGRIIGLPPAVLPHAHNSLWSATFSHRRVLWHGQKGTGISERLLCKQIRYPSVDSVRWCVRSSFFPGSGAVRMLTRFAFKFSFGIRPARDYRQRLRSWTCQDSNVYASSLSFKDTFLNLIRG
jgi:hypothetical protein